MHLTMVYQDLKAQLMALIIYQLGSNLKEQINMYWSVRLTSALVQSFLSKDYLFGYDI